MRRIGLLGGMSWESTAIYYRLINEAVRDRRGGLTSADIVMRSLDFQSVVDLQKAGQWREAAHLLGQAACDLQFAGADCVLICTNTMHLVSAEIAIACKAPLIDIIDETACALKESHHTRPLLLATRYTMEHGFYAERMQKHGIIVMTPDEAGRTRCHNIIFDELCQGIVNSHSSKVLNDLVREAGAVGADSVILGCTELCLSVSPDALPLPAFDSTRIHALAAVDFALMDIAIPLASQSLAMARSHAI